MFEEIPITRILLMLISILVVAVITKVRKDQRTGNQFFIIMVLFWSAVFITAFRPSIFEDVVVFTGLFNVAQLLLIFSIIIILYLLAIQVLKNKNAAYSLHNIVREIAISNFKRQVRNSIQHETDLIIVIAAKNESKTLGGVIERIKSLNIPYSYKIIVVNDGSTDDTESISLERGASTINHSYNLGIGGAIKTGYVAARIFKPDIVITIDADGQHDPKFIPEIISKIKNHGADMVYASRFSTASNYKTTKVRSIGNRFYTWLVNKIAGISITDVTSGYRAVKFDRLDDIFFIAETNFAIELAIRAGRNGLKITEIPVTTFGRDAGTSQFHKIERFLIYNVNAMTQILDAFLRSPKLD